MIKNNYGRIVNIASVSGKDGNANASAYSSAKAGVIGLTKSLGKELATYNIAVNAVTPAGAKTSSKTNDRRACSKNVIQCLEDVLEVSELTSMVCYHQKKIFLQQQFLILVVADLLTRLFHRNY